MEATDFRIGNIIEYYIDTDNLGWQKCRLDHQDLKRLSEQPESFRSEHRLIPLTEEILLKCRFIKMKDKDAYIYNLSEYRTLQISNLTENPHCWLKDIFTTSNFEYVFISHPKYVHQLQNLIHALTNEELIINF